MRTIKDECVGCSPGMGCLGSSCPNKNVKRYYCDKCGGDFESEELFVVDGEDVCVNCILKEYRTVAQEEG